MLINLFQVTLFPFFRFSRIMFTDWDLTGDIIVKVKRGEKHQAETGGHG